MDDAITPQQLNQDYITARLHFRGLQPLTPQVYASRVLTLVGQEQLSAYGARMGQAFSSAATAARVLGASMADLGPTLLRARLALRDAHRRSRGLRRHIRRQKALARG